MRWPRRRRDDQDARVAEARACAEAAQREVELSRQRQEAIRKHVNEPRQRFAEQNSFADMIRASLIEGRNEGKP